MTETKQTPVPIPKVRRDGMCRVCKGPRRTDRQAGVSEEAYLSDPFCSSACARAWWGTSLPQNIGGHPRKYEVRA